MPDAGDDAGAEPDDDAGHGAEHKSGRHPIEAGRQRDAELAVTASSHSAATIALGDDR